MTRKIVVFIAITLAVILWLAGHTLSNHTGILQPKEYSSDVKHLKKSILMQRKAEYRSDSRCNTSSEIIDTLTWRKEGASEVVNFGFINPGDSALVWFKPAAHCSLIAIRFKPWNWEGNILFDIWDGSRYSPHIYSPDSTDELGWCPLGTEIGPYYTIQCISPLGWDCRDAEHHFWGPHPYTITEAHSDAWIEIPAEIGIQGQVDLGDSAFYIGASFYITQGWGFYAQQAYPGSTPYNFFKYYSAGVGPDGVHDGWFLRSYQLWFEAVVTYYENTPPQIDDMTIQNFTYDPGPFPISAYISDKDADNPVNAGVARAYLVYTVNNVTDSTRMNGPCNGGTFVGTIPSISKNDAVCYYISAYDPHKLHSKSMKVTFARIEPENPGADILVIWDDTHNPSLDTFFVDLFAYLHTRHQSLSFELWNVSKRNGIDASVIKWGWHHIYVSGCGCKRTLPGRDYAGNLFAEWLEEGYSEAPHCLLYFDQDYFCAHDEYGCDWAGQLAEGDFLYDYFGVKRAISDNHGVEVGSYDSVVVGETYTEFRDLEVDFLPDALYPSTPENRLWPDWLAEYTDDAEQIFHYKDHPEFGAGVRLDRGHYKTVFLPWPDFFAMDSLENGDLIPRPELTAAIRRILGWFGFWFYPETLNVVQTPLNIPDNYNLAQNYPNPFNSETKIGFQLAEDCRVELSIYNVLGQHIRTLFEGQQPEGSYSVTWNGKDDLGGTVSSGVYLYRMQAGDFTVSRRMLLLK